jgi:hypothetical protein
MAVSRVLLGVVLVTAAVAVQTGAQGSRVIRFDRVHLGDGRGRFPTAYDLGSASVK